MSKRPKQFRLEGKHVLLVTLLRSYMGLPYDSDVGAAAVQCLGEQVAARFAEQGNSGDLAALIPVMNDVARLSRAVPAGAPDPYRYDQDHRHLLRWSEGTYQVIPPAFPIGAA